MTINYSIAVGSCFEPDGVWYYPAPIDAAAQLAEDGWGTIILACRSVEKADAARAKLVERTGNDPFEALAIDTSDVVSSKAAAEELRTRGARIDFLVLNAGASKKEATFNADGVEITYASTLVGHHVLTMQALADGLLAPKARIVIAGSEGARGNLPGMKLHDLDAIAADQFGGDLVATIEALVRLKLPEQKKFSHMNEYVTAKLLVAWWAAALARKLPAGMVVNAVSPGAVLATSFARDASAGMRYIMMPMMKVFGPLLGMQGPVSKAARRYLDAAELDDTETGQFYATAHRKKLVGPVAVQTWPEYFQDERGQQASFDALAQLTGVDYRAAADGRASA
jgi:NAD(P)-dependent dehydrogenase (short-subunit alcohol dehydrogenase family)